MEYHLFQWEKFPFRIEIPRLQPYHFYYVSFLKNISFLWCTHPAFQYPPYLPTAQLYGIFLEDQSLHRFPSPQAKRQFQLIRQFAPYQFADFGCLCLFELCPAFYPMLLGAQGFHTTLFINSPYFIHRTLGYPEYQ
ncbi:MAG: hypothetical protein ORN54_00620 [Cyclobacteriaceae bacterium]|nr:hypothetical protein [Cyclobacteriaceae bacterium]